MRVLVARPSELSVTMKEQIFALLEQNMRPLYEENWSWDSRAKQQELDDTASRFLIAIPASAASNSVRRTTRHSPSDPPLLGFIMWRFEDYDALPDDPTTPRGEDTMEVAYWYAPC